mmetsp:Transcript_74649/g.242570  ORF Transcript_74649/g.242570 Transcript_74649/m.242570 type:complete len:206 (+) Transcript_74649:457-1074(+)
MCGWLTTVSKKGFFAFAQRKHWNLDAKLWAWQTGQFQSPGRSLASPGVPTIVVIRLAIANCSAACNSLEVTRDTEVSSSKPRRRRDLLRLRFRERERPPLRLRLRLRRRSREPLSERRRFLRLSLRSRSRSFRALELRSRRDSGSYLSLAVDALTKESASAESLFAAACKKASLAARAAAAAPEMFDKAEATALAAATFAARPLG